MNAKRAGHKVLLPAPFSEPMVSQQIRPSYFLRWGLCSPHLTAIWKYYTAAGEGWSIGFNRQISTICDRARTQSRVGVEIFDQREKILPDLDGVERHTGFAEGETSCFPFLPHGECGAWGNAPWQSLGLASACPFQRAKRTGGCCLLSVFGATWQGATPPLKGSRGSPSQVTKRIFGLTCSTKLTLVLFCAKI